MKNEVKRKSTISLEIGLNEDSQPVDIQWKSTDNPNSQDFSSCKAFALSIFEKENHETLKIDLWTLDMQVDEMDRFVYNTFRGLVDTYYRATKNGDLANEMQNFVTYFGQKTGILEEEG